ncbi:MAG: hypothetical protein WKF66_05035 [Pedobacter sp.]
MYLSAFLFQVAIFIIPAIVIITYIHYLFRQEFDKYLDLKFAQQGSNVSDPLLPLRLQAHERMIVFVERINPSNVLIRLHQQGISVSDLQSLVINEINSEYQHNITQQLYVNDSIWNVIKKLKDDTIAMVGNGAKGLPPEASGVDLSKRVLQHMATMQDNPYDLTLKLIKNGIYEQS